MYMVENLYSLDINNVILYVGVGIAGIVLLFALIVIFRKGKYTLMYFIECVALILIYLARHYAPQEVENHPQEVENHPRQQNRRR